MQGVLDYVASVKSARKMLSYDPAHPIHCGPIKVCIYGARRTYRTTTAKQIALALGEKPYALCIGLRKQKDFPLPFRTTTKRFIMEPVDGVLLIDDYDHQDPNWVIEAIDLKCWAVIIIVCGLDHLLPKDFRPFITPFPEFPPLPNWHSEQMPLLVPLENQP